MRMNDPSVRQMDRFTWLGMMPESLGGETTLDNLQALCLPCNWRKGSKP